ncbi:helix-turn-helix domain-containing protein [Algoriphagus chordae]|uniref:helix-turn-helix domain-containing protein n=1 Tax=Algoriphagus chordae TaxID=237019 RepID=UPI000DADB3C8
MRTTTTVRISRRASDIAYETGFNTPAYFSKCFQKAYGMVPSAYNKTIRASA